MKAKPVLLVMLIFFILLELLLSVSHAETTWNIQTVDSADNIVYHTSLALDSLNNPHIAYFDNTHHDLKYAKWTGKSWNVQTVAPNIFLCDPAIALDSLSNPHIAFTNMSALKYATWNGSSWNIQTIWEINPQQSVIFYDIDLAIDSNGSPHISYLRQVHTATVVNYCFWNGSAWEMIAVDDAYYAYGTSIALDSKNSPHISYYHEYATLYRNITQDLKYASKTSSGWNIETVDSNGNVGSNSSLALDKLDNPHVSYCDTTNGDLKYAKWTGSSWNFQIVDPNFTGGGISLALDSSNNPKICYCDGASGNLRYAKLIGNSWSIQTINTNGVVSGYPSLALDSENNPHVSYYDSTNIDLRYATGSDSIFTLTVESEHGNPTPPVGNYSYNSASQVTCSISSPVTEGNKVWTCTGWSGTGSVPSSGTGLTITFNLTSNSTITWNWATNDPTPTPSQSPTPSPTPTPTPTPEPTPTPTASPTPTPTFSPTQIPTPTPTPNPTVSPTPTTTNTPIPNVPVIELTSPINNGSEVKSSSLQISWKKTDAALTVDHYEVKLDEGAWTNIGTQTSYEFSGLIDGIHTFAVKSVDESGLNQIYSVNVLVTAGGEQEVPLIYVGVVVAIIGVITFVALLILSFVRKRPKLANRSFI